MDVEYSVPGAQFTTRFKRGWVQSWDGEVLEVIDEHNTGSYERKDRKRGYLRLKGEDWEEEHELLAHGEYPTDFDLWVNRFYLRPETCVLDEVLS